MKILYYNLYHIYELKDKEVVKFIGVFSSINQAKEAINYLFLQPGFKEHPKKSFEIFKIWLNQYEWKEGFCSWEEAYEDK